VSYSRGGEFEPDFVGPSLWDAWHNRFIEIDIEDWDGTVCKCLVEAVYTMPELKAEPTPFYDLLLAEQRHKTKEQA
jgi:hypothetical protein